MSTKLQPAQLDQAVRAGDLASLRDQLDDLRPSEIANLISDLPPNDEALLFRCLPRDLASATFEYLPLYKQRGLLKALAHEEVADILNRMADDDRTSLL